MRSLQCSLLLSRFHIWGFLEPLELTIYIIWLRMRYFSYFPFSYDLGIIFFLFWNTQLFVSSMQYLHILTSDYLLFFLVLDIASPVCLVVCVTYAVLTYLLREACPPPSLLFCQ